MRIKSKAMILKTWRLFFTGLSVLWISCDEILFVEDISEENVVLLAPLSDTEVSTGEVIFTWESVQDAESYHLQLATPNFENASQILLDTLLRKRSFSKELLKKEYEWRVRAENTSYQTAYTQAFFRVVESEGFANKLVVLTSPIDNLITNTATQEFTWQPLEDATEYRLQIGSPDTAGTLLVDERLTTTSYTTSLEEGTFTWQVRGQNSTQNTLYNSRSLWVDRTPPNPVTQQTPANNSTSTEATVRFRWERENEPGSAEKDSLFVYAEEALNTLVFKAMGTDKSYEKEMEKGTYYWFVKSYDAAGNTNAASATFVWNLE